MMKHIKHLALGASFLFVQSMFAQSIKPCGQYDELKKLQDENPTLYQEYLKKDQMLEKHTTEFVKQRSGTRGTVYIIPVVFHIIHNYGIENISNEQVQDALRVINLDFRRLNADSGSTIAAFKGIAGDAEIEFRLAQRDPQGNCTNGIVRVASQETYKGNNTGSNPALSNLSRWPRDKYLNVWVVNKIESGAAGYSNYPGVFDGQPMIDGMVMLHNYVGSIGTSALGRSRTFTHEAGHWLNLRHTWGNSNNPGLASNCQDDDNVSDTPNTIGWKVCDLNGTTCGSLDNVQNYMDYSYCSNMFTQGQALRVRAALNSSVAQRSSLWQTSNLAATGVLDPGNLCKAEFEADRTEICAGQSVNFTDASYNTPDQWVWTISGGSPSSSNLQNPSATFLTPGVYNVGLNVLNASGSKSTTKNNYITVLDNKGKPGPYVESFESFNTSNSDWFFKNPDNGAEWELANVGATGSNSMMINNLTNIAGNEDELISNTIDVSTFNSIKLSFKVAYAQKNTDSNDMLKVYISSNCGETWMIRWSKSGADLASVAPQMSAFTPTQTQWREFSFNNIPASFLKSNFRFKFVFTAGNGNNIYIDDINISDPDNQVGIDPNSGNVQNLNVYPNPFSNESTIEFSLNQAERVQMSITDMIGKTFNLLSTEQILPAGSHQFRIDKNELNLSQGIYFLQVVSGGTHHVKKLIIR